ncbi:patatin-like phospholipase family protein [Pseudorhodoferax sp. LjRoot39]|uniref:hypothetical protein n=1 Tax=Pseudorhodoferax sp. LjRoot39 TaxID=3342328 RepID=UPI003ECD3C42
MTLEENSAASATTEGAMPPDAPCDLVMKGGITSGVIYPRLISTLAARYRFANIGGTSAGAIAAGACAAAEYRRRHGGGQAGFDQLDALPDLLSKKTGDSGRSKLFRLFQPTLVLRRHFEVLVAMLNKPPRAAFEGAVRSVLSMYPLWLVPGWLLASLLLTPLVHGAVAGLTGTRAWALAAIALAVVTGVAAMVGKVARSGIATVALLVPATAGLLAALANWMQPGLWGWRLMGIGVAFVVLAALLLALLALIVMLRFSVSLLRGLHANGYGVCSGRTTTGSAAAEEGLTDWLAGYLNDLAGLPQKGRPLQFRDLWGTPDAKAARDVHLEVMTSAVSQKMIYSIPFREGTPRFYYDPDAWAMLFPEAVMQCLTAAAGQGDADDDLPGGTTVVDAQGKPLRPLPRSADLPVVVAVRMSLSFPVLLSAVPLFSIDWSRAENQAGRAAQRHAAAGGAKPASQYVATKIWFSDGGIGSNMPLHMFDALLPDHPTFAVNLKDEHPDFPIREPEDAGNGAGRIYLPENNRGGSLRHFAAPADSTALGGLAGFLWSIVNTMQNWRDEIMFPYPGFRDRIVQISQRPAEGGLNLDMPKPSIDALSQAGAMAAQRLIDRFHPAGAQQGKGWRNHQVLRMGTFLGVMQPASAALHASLDAGTWQEHVRDIGYDSKAQQQLALDFLEALRQLGASSGDNPLSLESGALKPLAQMRISPRI